MSEKYFSDQCFVLKSIPFQSSDAHVILFGKKYGKFRVLAKGIGKPTSKLAPLLNNGNCLDVECVRGKNGITLTSCSPIEGFQSRYSCYEALLTGVYICDLVDVSTESDEVQEVVYHLMYFSLLAMNDRNYKEIRVLFEWKYLAILGYSSDDADSLYGLLASYWRTEGFDAAQQSIYDELVMYLDVFKSHDLHMLSLRLSQPAYRVIQDVMQHIYHDEAQIYVKSQKILEQAIGH